MYWIPLYELLESCGIEVLLVNARQLRYVPGRKSDMQDCQWIQLLHSCGLLRGSFRPHEIIVRVRTLHRQLSTLGAESTRFVQWMQKALRCPSRSSCGHRSDRSDGDGDPGDCRRERDPVRLAALRDERCKKSSQEFVEHLSGNWREELFNLLVGAAALRHDSTRIAAYEARILDEIRELQRWSAATNPCASQCDQGKGDSPFAARGGAHRTVALCRGRPDAHRRHRHRICPDPAEAGLDLTAFPSEKHFCPGCAWLRERPFPEASPPPKKTDGTGSTRVAAVQIVSLKHSKTALGAAFRRNNRWTVAVFSMARARRSRLPELRYGQDYVDMGDR